MKKSQLEFNNKNKSFHKYRRLKAFFFCISSLLLGSIPHVLINKYSKVLILIFTFCVFTYGVLLIFKNFKRETIDNKFFTKTPDSQKPTIDILVSARDEQNVVSRLIQMLFELDYPHEKLNIYIIDDGSQDNTNQILQKLAKKYEKLKIISRSIDAGGGKSGALNHALQFTSGEWIFILDADAQLKKDTLNRLISYALNESLYVVQLRKSVLNPQKNFLTACQSIEMTMDAVFQYGRLTSSGVSELRGNGQLIKKDLLLSCGSFNEDTVTDDLDLSVRLLLLKSKIGILWDPPVMEEAVENLLGLFSQRQRWAEGGLQRFFDYGGQLIFGDIGLTKKLDLTYFFLLQYCLPLISIIDVTYSLIFKSIPVYWPLSISAFTVSALAAWFGSATRNEGPNIPKPNILRIFAFMIYLSHWFIVIPLVTIKMSIFPKKILWKKTLHKGL